MIVIRFMGGLGNQMFQYALYEKIKKMNKKVMGDIYDSYKQDKLRKFDLYIFENINLVEADRDIRNQYSQQAKKLFNRILGKCFPTMKKIYFEKTLNYDEHIWKLKDTYLQGYWQSERYFADIRQELLEKFTFPNINDEVNLDYIKQIKQSVSVSIHVRRGDYLSEVNKKIYGNICTLEYYQKSIDYFENKYDDVKFFVFSNDIQWTKAHLKMRDVVYVEGNSEENGYKDMYLMTQCKHNIIANSSFSWWGAWLNQNEKKEVIAPNKWINTEEMKDIWCKEWKRF